MMRSTIALLLLASALSAQKRPITHEDVWLMKRVGALEVSPDGKWGVTSVLEPSYDAAKTASDLWLVSLDGKTPPRRATSLSTGASDPQWRPDGTAILFESRVYPGARNDEDNRKIAAERKERKYNLRIFDSFPIRYWDHWLDDLRPHVFVQGLEEGAGARDVLVGTKLAALPGFEGRSE